MWKQTALSENRMEIGFCDPYILMKKPNDELIGTVE
jgi:hypothetical protein